MRAVDSLRSRPREAVDPRITPAVPLACFGGGRGDTSPLQDRALFQRVGHFQHDGTVNNCTQLDLRLDTNQTNL